MPELPEVELVAQALNKLVAGRRIVAAELLRQRLAPAHAPEDFHLRLKDACITHVARRGKHILVHLDNNQILIVHLRMSGRFQLLSIEHELPKFTHAIFYMDDERRLIFSDQRHFGFMRVIAVDDLLIAKELKSLAPEPFSDDFTIAYLAQVLSRSKKSLKETLLDQTKVTGLGNIYAAEALFLSKTNPFQPAHELSKRRVPKLHSAIIEVLNESVAHGSTLNVDPENIDGSYYGGGYENHWRVYDREGEACLRCKTVIERRTQAGRSTYFCPRCQKT